MRVENQPLKQRFKQKRRIIYKKHTTRFLNRLAIGRFLVDIHILVSFIYNPFSPDEP